MLHLKNAYIGKIVEVDHNRNIHIGYISGLSKNSLKETIYEITVEINNQKIIIKTHPNNVWELS
jgi:hypothetical protein